METIPGHLERLPAGGDRFQAEQLSRSPRQRILAALAELVAKRGYQGTTIEHIVKRASVARATFYEHFANREDCLLACFAESEAELQALLQEAASEAGEWPEQLRACLAAFLDYVVSHRAVARTCLVEMVTAGPAAMKRYEQAVQRVALELRRGRAIREADGELPDTLEDMIAGGLVWMVHGRLVRNELDEIGDLRTTMLEFALTPYLGEARAAAISAAG